MSKTLYTSNSIREMLFPVFKSYGIKKATLFGSYAKGAATENSDVDILVDSGLKGLHFFGLLEDVVTTLGKDVDLLDVTQLAPNSEVGREIANTGVVIYGK